MSALKSTIRTFTLFIGTAVIFTCAWLHWRLVSKPLQAEFVHEA